MLGGTASAFGFGAAAPVSQRAAAVESWTATAADVDAWLGSAKPGERLVYARGPQLVQGAAAALLRKLTDAGEVITHNRRDPATGLLEFIAVRNRVRLVTQRAPACDAHMMAVLLVVNDAALNGERCPSDAAIGDQTGLTADQAKWQLKKLADAKLIERRNVPTKSDSRFRVVRVVATGAETASPRCAA
jgi:hypothetical protein